MDKNIRKLHRRMAPILFLPLLLSALTGIAYRVGRNWFKIPNEWANTLLVIHQGEYLGKRLVPIYILLVGFGLLVLLGTGLIILIQTKRQKLVKKRVLTGRTIHRWIVPFAALPLCITAITGISFRLGKNWFGMPNEWASLLLNIHQGTYFGSDLRLFYILILGLSLLALLVTGIQMTGLFTQKRRKINVDS